MTSPRRERRGARGPRKRSGVERGEGPPRPNMKCPFCAHLGDKVVDSRESKEGEVIRRRRECLECGKRFTSYERIDEIPYMVVKKDGTPRALRAAEADRRPAESVREASRQRRRARGRRRSRRERRCRSAPRRKSAPTKSARS